MTSLRSGVKLGLMKKHSYLFALFGFILVAYGAIEPVQYMLLGDANAAKRSSGLFFLGFALLVIWSFVKNKK